MGNQCLTFSAPGYIAKETFHPSDDAFHDLPPHKDEKGELEKDYEKHKEELKKEGKVLCLCWMKTKVSYQLS